MKSRSSASNQLSAHIRDILDAKSLHGLIIILDRIESLLDSRRDLGLAEASHTVKASERLNGHDAGDDGDIDANGSAVLDPLQVDVHVVEKLRDDAIGTSVHFILQVL